MNQITVDMLKAVVARINRMTGSPEATWQRIGDKLVGQVGNYHLDNAYGKWSLVRMHNEQGAVNRITDLHSKRDLMDHLYTFIAGLEAR